MTLAKMVWSTGIWVDLYQGILFVAQVMLFSFFLQEKSPRSKSGSMKRNNSMTRLPDEVSTSVQDFCVLQIRPVFFRLLSFFWNIMRAFYIPNAEEFRQKTIGKCVSHIRFIYRILQALTSFMFHYRMPCKADEASIFCYRSIKIFHFSRLYLHDTIASCIILEYVRL